MGGGSCNISITLKKKQPPPPPPDITSGLCRCSPVVFSHFIQTCDWSLKKKRKKEKRHADLCC